ncbi:MAG: ABC-2 family transporter protein [Myxococcota bacterium]|nr:ABC-2 family transporter protein [Myxococcota bacterium]
MRRTLRAMPTLFRVGLAESMAYRAELLIWVLTTTMPLVMLPLWMAVAETGPVQGFTGEDFVAYFLATFCVRQVTSAWASWTINYEVKSGTLALRLMRPIHPFWAYAVENLAAIPLRLAVAGPFAIGALMITSGDRITSDPAMLAIFVVALIGAWAITFLAHVAVGTLSMWTQSSIKIMDVWTAGFFVLSGYLVPIALFPEAVRWLPDWLPFRYQLGFPVEVLTRGLAIDEALSMLARQWAFVAGLGVLCVVLWKKGLARFQAYGG